MTKAPTATDLASALVQCPSVTPEEAGVLTLLDDLLKPFGFEVHRPVFFGRGISGCREYVRQTLWRRRSASGPLLAMWMSCPWAMKPPGRCLRSVARLKTRHVALARGTADMKGGVAAFVAATLRYIEEHGTPKGTVSFVLTGDEEGPAVNGTVKLMEWAAERGESFSASVLGEPTNPNAHGRHDQGRPTRQPIGHRHGYRQAGAMWPIRILPTTPVPVLAKMVEHVSAQSLDKGHRFLPAQQSGVHFLRRRQSGLERHSRKSRSTVQCTLQRSLECRKAQILCHRACSCVPAK